jgi:hypothetical protein
MNNTNCICRRDNVMELSCESRESNVSDTHEHLSINHNKSIEYTHKWEVDNEVSAVLSNVYKSNIVVLIEHQLPCVCVLAPERLLSVINRVMDEIHTEAQALHYGTANGVLMANHTNWTRTSAPFTSIGNTCGDTLREQVTTDKQHEFQQCGKVYCRHGCVLQYHKRAHTNIGPYTCDKCCKRFTRRYFLQQHMRTHTRERPYKCSVCDKRYSTHAVLQHHIVKHSTEPMYNCTLCDRKFFQRTCLYFHKQTHTDEQAAKCRHCSKCV